MNPFLTACQATEPIRLEVRRGGSVSELSFEKAAVLVGRDGRADLNLLDSDVGSRHLYLQVLRGRLFAVQLADRSYTMSRGRPWLGGWVDPGHEFEIGRVTLRVLGPPPPGGRLARELENPLVPDRSREPAYLLEPISSRSSPPRQFAYRQELLLAGRSSPCRLVVRHPDVSRCHAAIVRTPSSLWIVDLLSRCGVSVNGVPVASAEIREGDRIEFGRVGVRVNLPREPHEAPEQPGGVLVPELPVQPPADRSLDPVLDQFAAMQQQTFEQFQELLATMMQMVGGILNEQRQFVREELDRIERLATASQIPALPAASNGQAPAAAPAEQPATPPPAPDTPPPSRPAFQPGDEVQLHAWLDQQLGSLNRQQSAAWERLVRLFRGQ